MHCKTDEERFHRAKQSLRTYLILKRCQIMTFQLRRELVNPERLGHVEIGHVFSLDDGLYLIRMILVLGTSDGFK